MNMLPSKRFNRGGKEPNGKRFRKSPGFISQKQAMRSSSNNVIFRVLCPADKIARVMGKDGSTISEIRQETGAKIRVDETVAGCDDRVIFIMGPDKEADNAVERTKNEEEGNADVQEGDVEEKQVENGDKESPPVKDSQSEMGTSAVQKALLLVFEKINEKEKEVEGGNAEDNESSSVSWRFLVLSGQVGHLLGKGGSVVKKITAETGVRILVPPKEKLPACVSSSDDVVQITGELEAVKKAIRSVSEQIMENSAYLGSSLLPSHSFGHHGPRFDAISSQPFPLQGASYGVGSRDGMNYHSHGPPLFPEFHDGSMHNRMNSSSETFTFRLLCPDEKVGVVIGKGGNVIKMLQRDMGCEIKVLQGVPGEDDRIIVISGVVHPDERISAVQNALLRVVSLIAKTTPDGKDNGAGARLVVPSSQIGCLLGKGGAVINEMRTVTGAYIRVLGKDQIPKCVAGNEVVQVNGDLEVVQEALRQITTRLRHHFFRDVFPQMKLPMNPVLPDLAQSLPQFMGRRELSPPGAFGNVGPAFRQFDSVGGPPLHGGFHPSDDRPPFMHDIHRSGIPHLPERPWGPQGFEGPLLGSFDYSGGPQRRMTGLGGGSQQAIITNTTVEVVVPSSLVPSIYGEDGGCLKQIRQISDAKITITDPKPGANETIIIISGSPEQTHAAQSLIQAFVMSETGTA